MNLIFLGPPGAGKGTQSQHIVNTFSLPHIATGDIFREARKNQTELGRKAESYMNAGQLVPDEVTIGIVRERLQKDDCKSGFLLDGFPRNVAQAQALDQMLAGLGKKIDTVLNFQVPEDELILRLSGRRVCQSCGTTFHMAFAPPKTDGICDRCQGSVIQRKDDSEETVRKRLAVYTEQTLPLVDYYSKKQILKILPGVGTIEQISSKLDQILQGH